MSCAKRLGNCGCDEWLSPTSCDDLIGKRVKLEFSGFGTACACQGKEAPLPDLRSWKYNIISLNANQTIIIPSFTGTFDSIIGSCDVEHYFYENQTCSGGHSGVMTLNQVRLYFECGVSSPYLLYYITRDDDPYLFYPIFDESSFPDFPLVYSTTISCDYAPYFVYPSLGGGVPQGVCTISYQ